MFISADAAIDLPFQAVLAGFPDLSDLAENMRDQAGAQSGAGCADPTVPNEQTPNGIVDSPAVVRGSAAVMQVRPIRLHGRDIALRRSATKLRYLAVQAAARTAGCRQDL
jgi:hypothetical protein